MKSITDLNELIYAGTILVNEKIGVSLRNMNRNSKPGYEIRPETQIKYLSQQAKIQKKGKTWEYVGIKREKKNAGKSNNITWRDKSEGTGERRQT